MRKKIFFIPNVTKKFIAPEILTLRRKQLHIRKLRYILHKIDALIPILEKIFFLKQTVKTAM